MLGKISLILHPEELETPSWTGEFDASIAFDLERHAWIGALLLRYLLEIQAQGKKKSMTSVARYQKHARVSRQLGLLDEGKRLKMAKDERELEAVFARSWKLNCVAPEVIPHMPSSSSSQALQAWPKSSAKRATQCSRLTSRTARITTSAKTKCTKP